MYVEKKTVIELFWTKKHSERNFLRKMRVCVNAFFNNNDFISKATANALFGAASIGGSKLKNNNNI